MVRLSSVSKSFGGTKAVDKVGFSLDRGQFLTVLGPSGSGKTTVLRMIAGFLNPDEGQIEIHGHPVSAIPAYRRSIGMVFQKLALFPHLSVAANVAYPLKMRGFSRREIPDRVSRYLDIVQLPGFERRRIHELSGGQQQRVAIARALVFEPDLLLLDEPLAALDRKLREDMQLEFRRIQRELGVTTINVTHDQREALVMSDRVIVMDGGRVEQDARPNDVYAHPTTRFVSAFLGVTNLLAGRVDAIADDGFASVTVGDAQIGGRLVGDAARPGDRIEASVRAERVRIVQSGAPDADPVDGGTFLARGTVEEIVYEGDRLVASVLLRTLGPATLKAFVDGSTPLRAGESVDVMWAADDVFLFPVKSIG